MDLTKIPYCIDCGSQERAVYWGGGPRCQRCSDRFREHVHAERVRKFQRERDALNAHIGYHHQHGECPDDGLVCESCCEHEFDSSEGFLCNHCGAEPW